MVFFLGGFFLGWVFMPTLYILNIYIYFVVLVCFICIGVRIAFNVYSSSLLSFVVVHIGTQPVVPLVAKTQPCSFRGETHKK